MKKILFLLFLITCLALPKTIAADDTQCVTLNVNTTAKDGSVTVEIKYTGEMQICGGSIDLNYNKSRLVFEKYATGEALSQVMHFVNESYLEDCIRLNWASVSPLDKSGDIITVSFNLLGDSFEENDILVKSVKFIDENDRKLQSVINYSVQNELAKTDDFSNSSPSKGYGGGGITYRPQGVQTNEEEKKVDTQNTAESQVNWENTFDDVNISDWNYEAVKFVCNTGLMRGVSASEFKPDSVVTRGMFVTVLYRLEGEPETEACTFGDVTDGEWYEKAVAWAVINGIVYGMSATEFAPDTNITREQIATIMFRYAQYKGMDAITSEENLYFTDSGEISEYAVSAMNWAVGTGLMKGKSTTTINPKDNATRAEIAAILQRFIEGNE